MPQDGPYGVVGLRLVILDALGLVQDEGIEENGAARQSLDVGEQALVVDELDVRIRSILE